MRQNPPGPELAFEAFVIDEAVDGLENRLQLFGEFQILVLFSLIRTYFKNHREHRLLLFSWIRQWPNP